MTVYLTYTKNIANSKSNRQLNDNSLNSLIFVIVFVNSLIFVNVWVFKNKLQSQ